MSENKKAGEPNGIARKCIQKEGKKQIKHSLVVNSEAAMQELRNRRVSNNIKDSLLKSHKSLQISGVNAPEKSKIGESFMKNAGKFENSGHSKTDQDLSRERRKSHFSNSQADVSKRTITISALSRNKKSKNRGYYKTEGKTYKSRQGPKDVDMNDPKWKEKLDNWHRRDTKSGGLSWSSRIRLDPNRIRLGSDRFSRPRSDRIYSCSEDCEDEDR